MFKQISSKKWGWLLLFVIIFFVIIFYDNNSPKNKVIENPNFDAKVIEIKDTIILVEALNTQKEIIVGTNHTNKSLSIGDLINIEYRINRTIIQIMKKICTIPSRLIAGT